MNNKLKYIIIYIFLILHKITSYKYNIQNNKNLLNIKLNKHSLRPLYYSKNGNNNPFKILWDFARPHTLIGSGISVLSLYMYSTTPSIWKTKLFFNSVLKSLLPSLFMNIYITGLNQITDIEIDKINKPYLPLASGKLSKKNGILIVLSSLLLSLYLIKNSTWPLKLAVLGSGLLGTFYSLYPFRLKRYPLLAAICIILVRGSLINLGFFLQAKNDLLNILLPSSLITCLKLYPQIIYTTSFFAIFGLIIALMKDVPDIEGDKIFNISSFSVKLGATKMFRY